MQERSVNTIMKWLTDTVRNKEQVSPHQFVEAAEYLVILIGDEHTKLYDMEQKVAQMKVDLLKENEKVNKVNLLISATEEYKEMRKQKAKIEQINETIRVSKLMARMRDTEMRLN